jgi:hypothetical protein
MHRVLLLPDLWCDLGGADVEEVRLYCPLAPCLPAHEGQVNDVIVAMSWSFATHEAYWRHIENGHFIAAANGPLPYVIRDDEEAVA